MASIVHLLFARFVDRDMFMQFRGRGIGHKSTQERTQVFEHQSHVLPLDDEEALAVDGVDSEEEPEESEEENDDESLEFSGDGAEEDEMGGEDGEEPWDDDDVEAEGYAQL